MRAGTGVSARICISFGRQVLYLVKDSLVAPLRLDDLPDIKGKCYQHSDEEAKVEAGVRTTRAFHRTLPIDFPHKPRKPTCQAKIVNLKPLGVTLLED